MMSWTSVLLVMALVASTQARTLMLIGGGIVDDNADIYRQIVAIVVSIIS